MITFRLTKQDIRPNTFITVKTFPLSKALNSFGYIRRITKYKMVMIDWYDNYKLIQIKRSLRDCKEDYKSIYPYFNTSFVRGNIWKHSYNVLLSKINPETGFTKIKVDKVTYKKPAYKGMNVIISDAVFVLSNNITKLEGKVTDVLNHREHPLYRIKTVEGEFEIPRTSFLVLPQDYFILLSVRC